LFFSTVLLGQNLPNDCVNYVQVCDDQSVTFDVSGAGVQEIVPPSCGSNENNSLWIRVSIGQSGKLGFTIIPQSTDINEDYDFWVFGPNVSCNELNAPIRCSTTNPSAAGQSNNHTGLNGSSTDLTEGPGANGDSFLKELDVLAGESYYVVIDRPIGNSPFSLNWTGTATITNPFATQIFPDFDVINLCVQVSSLSTPFNFTTLNAAFLGSVSGYALTYFGSFQDAATNSNQIIGLNDVFSVTYYARITHIQSGCFVIKPVTVNLIPFEATDVARTLCENTLTQTVDVDLSSYRNLIYNNPSAVFEYYTSLANANSATNQITNFQNRTLAVGIHVIYVKVTQNNCSDIALLTIEVVDRPTINQTVTLVQCDDDVDGFSFVNLNQANNLITTQTGLTFTYFLTNLEASNNSNQIQNYTAFLNQSVGSGVVYCRIVNANNCVRVAQVNLVISVSAIPQNFMIDFHECDDVASGSNIDRITTNFDFSSATTTILNLFPSPLNQQLTVSYYKSESDALAEFNQITNTSNFSNIDFPISQNIFVRVDSQTNNECFGLGHHITLHADKIPEIELIGKEEIICLNNPTYYVTLNAGLVNFTTSSFYSYQWSLNQVPINGANSYTLNVNASGLYSVAVFNAANCANTRTITVSASESATITNIIITDIVDVNSVVVIVDGIGDYVYSLDGFYYQISNTFYNVEPGLNTVYVKDLNNCGIVDRNIGVLSIPKFFTPNGDGFNDLWNIKGYNARFNTNTTLSIYNRFGKLLKQISSDSQGWDGIFNGQQLPSTDYWYVVKLEDGRIEKGHFSLKR